MKILSYKQGSVEWHAARHGIATASQFDRIITPAGKPASASKAHTYMYELAYERLTGKLWRRDLSNIKAVQDGIRNEPYAVTAFEARTNLKTEETGLHLESMPAGSHIGASPDRLVVGTREAVEIKCPTGPVHVGYLIGGLDDYKAQIQGQIMVGKFDCVHFFSWHEEFPPHYEIVEPDLKFIAELYRLLNEFNRELLAGVEYVRALGNWPSNQPSVFPDPVDTENNVVK